MSFFVRVFSIAEDFPSLSAICDELVDAGFEFATAPGKQEPEFLEQQWKSLLLQYDEKLQPIAMERNTKELGAKLFLEEQKEFLETLKALPYSRNQKKAVEIIKGLEQIYAFEVQEDISEDGWDFLECVLDFLCDATDGYVQVDEEGIYDKEGNLLVEID